MKPFPLLPSLLFSFGVALAAIAQDGPPRRLPPHDAQVEAALDDCWVDLDGALGDMDDDDVEPEMMDQCMADKGFGRPMGPPPGRDDRPPPPPSPTSTRS